MRKVLLLTLAATLALAGVAYAATHNPNYILNGSVTPKKSGTARHGVPISAKLGWTVKPATPGRRPPVVQSFRFYFQGIQQNVKYFPACSTSTLNSTGPSGCRKGSQIGSGSYTVAIGPSSTNTVSATCNVENSLFNGGGDNLILYIYTDKTMANQCPLNSTYAVLVGLFRAHGGRDLVLQFSAPNTLRHPAPGIEAAILSSTESIRKATVTRKVRGKKVVIGLFATDYCPPNHQRVIKATFAPEKGPTTPVTATKHIACS